MAQIQILRIVMASPGDVQAEREALPAVVNELNRAISSGACTRLPVTSGHYSPVRDTGQSRERRAPAPTCTCWLRRVGGGATTA